MTLIDAMRKQYRDDGEFREQRRAMAAVMVGISLVTLAGITAGIVDGCLKSNAPGVVFLCLISPGVGGALGLSVMSLYADATRDWQPAAATPAKASGCGAWLWWAAGKAVQAAFIVAALVTANNWKAIEAYLQAQGVLP